MDSAARSRKRGSVDQLDRQIENPESGNNKRSKASLQRILEPVPADNPSFTAKPAQFAVLGDDRALDVSDYNVGLREQQSQTRPMISSQSRREGEGLSGTIAHESMDKQDSQTPVNGSAGQSPATVHHMSPVSMSDRQPNQGIALAGEPDRPVVGMNHNRPSGNHALQEYKVPLMLLEQQNKRFLMERKAQEEQGTALRTITSLLDQLNIAHTSVKELLENLPVYPQKIVDFKHSIPDDIDALQRCQAHLDDKEAEIKALENRYNELIEMTPVAQRGELQQVKGNAMLTLQQNLGRVRLDRDIIKGRVERKNDVIEGLEGALGRARELVPELIEDLVKLAPKLRDVNDQL